MRLEKYDILKLNYKIMIVVLHFAVFIQVLSIPLFPTVVEAERISCDGEGACEGTDEDDVLYTGQYIEDGRSFFGHAGDDHIEGSKYSDDLRGEEGNDLIYGNKGNDILDGGFGDDDLRDSGGDNEIIGGYGADIILGGDGDDEILSGSDIDRSKWGDDSKDDIRCGLGDDTVYMDVSEGDEAADDCENVITG